MKLNYNIIWVDDKIDTRPYISIKKEIFDFITDEFFNCKIEEAEDFNEFTNLFADDITYDLIITDLSLNSGTTGKQVIDFIRDNKHNHTEIFFYSANTQLRQQQLINSNRITFYQLTEGNYNELKNEIIDLVRLTISKFQHIVAMRGMIMHETSSLDVVMNYLVKNFIEDSKNKDNVDKILPPIFLEIQKNAKEKCDKAFSNKPNKILKDNVLFSASQKVFALGKILEILEQKDFSEDYNKEIIWFRNQFAHAEIFVNEEGKEYFKIKIEGVDQELLFDEKLCKGIRKNIIKHKENLDNLELIMK
jgi:hypothetical protein